MASKETLTVELTREEARWILALTGPRVAHNPGGVYPDPAYDLDYKLRAALEESGKEGK